VQTEVAVAEFLNKLTSQINRVIFKESVSKISVDRAKIMLCGMREMCDYQQ
jgi:hypothetical protein